MLSSGAIAGDTNEVVMDAEVVAEKIESTAVASDGIILPFFLLLLLIIAGAA
ncbi:hypothetical protein N8454_00735 [bacterium]|nr:hypothetical protein [bacterium]